MATRKERPSGLWESPLSPVMLAGEKRLSNPQWDHSGQLVWREERGGRGVLVVSTLTGDAPRDLTSDLNVRAEIGYGGGDFCAGHGLVIFAVHKTGRLFRQAISGGAARPITPVGGHAAAPRLSPDGKFVAYVHQDSEKNDRIAVVEVEGSSWPQVLTAGHDFYMQPRWSPDGRWFAWIAWDHPQMPWDGTTLYLAEVQATGDLPRLGPPHKIAGGKDIAIFQPEFLPDSSALVYVSDEPGWARLALTSLRSGKSKWLTEDDAEYGAPAWVQDRRTYAISADGRLVYAARNSLARDTLVRIELATGTARTCAELSDYSDLLGFVTAPESDQVAMVASGSLTPPRLVVYAGESGETKILARSSGETVPADELAMPEPLSWPTADGEIAHGLYYPPTSREYQASGPPPILVTVHGGPTSQAKAGWRPDVQYFATRGYAVLVLNYRGSTGYGREYMLKLRGNWGICDVQDAVSGLNFLGETGRADLLRSAIQGGSAGGFTVLQTMIAEPSAFAVGINLYGVSNHFNFADDTTKFEMHYLDSLLGPLPEAAALYRERSPIFQAEKIRRPLAMFQGDNDLVVPRNQSDSVAEALKRRGVPVTYHVYAGEGHGWRKPETIEHYYRTVEQFLRQYLLFS